MMCAFQSIMALAVVWFFGCLLYDMIIEDVEALNDWWNERKHG